MTSKLSLQPLVAFLQNSFRLFNATKSLTLQPWHCCCSVSRLCSCWCSWPCSITLLLFCVQALFLLVFLAMFLYTVVVLCPGSVPAGVPGHVPLHCSCSVSRLCSCWCSWPCSFTLLLFCVQAPFCLCSWPCSFTLLLFCVQALFLLVFLAMFLDTAVVLCLGSVPAGVPGRNVHGHVPGWSVWRIFQS